MLPSPKKGKQTHEDKEPLEMNGNSMKVTIPVTNESCPQQRFPYRSVHSGDEHSLFRQFAKENLKERVCSSYVFEKQSGNENVCSCRHPESWHQERNILPYYDPKVKWDPNLHTKALPSTTYGQIEFGGFGNVKPEPAPYARVSYDTSPEILWKLLHNVWRLPPPKLVVSVTGGAKLFYMKPRLQNAFKQGLMDVASTTEAWIITGGTATGVMKYVGEALAEYQLSATSFTGDRRKKMVAIGVAAWGCIDNKENLESPSGEGCFPAVYSLRDCIAQTEGEAPLDHNHTHFIFVDNGTVTKYGTEIQLRANLESFIAKRCAALTREMSLQKSHPSEISTPVVLIVCEGGPNTLQQTRDAIRVDIPAVVIKRSGRAADIIAAAYRLSRPKVQSSEEKSEFSAYFGTEMEGLICSGFGLNLIKDVQKIHDILDTLKEILTKRRLITIFELDDSNCRDMDKAVLRALLKAKPNPQSQVDLALIWNRADIARQQIFTLENRRQWQAIALEDAMHSALCQGREDFVQLFLDNGIHLGSFLTIRRLRNLYSDSLADHRKTMPVIIKHMIHVITLYDRICSFGCSRVNTTDTESILLFLIGKILRFLMNDKFEHPYTGEEFIIEVDRKTSSHPSSLGESKEKKPLLKNMKGSVMQDFQNPEKHLFLWALLFNQRDLARMFWRNCKDPLGGALIACRILKSLANEAKQQEEITISQELHSEAEYYEQLACGVLSTCYSLNKQLAHKLLRRELNSWGQTTLFSLAESAKLMDFMQMSCCQTKLNQLWYGNIVDYTQDWKILLGIFLPAFVSLIRFKNKNTAKNPNMEVQTPAAYDELQADNQSIAISAAAAEAESDAETKSSAGKWFVSFNCCGIGKHDPDSISFLSALYQFYTAPVTKYYVNVTFYILFLCLFTVVVLSELKPVKDFSMQGIFEIVIWAWAFSLFIEGIRQILRREAKSAVFKFWNHIKDFWNLLDMLMFLLFVVSLFLRLGENEQYDHWARITYAITLMFAYLRIMKSFYVSKTIGPKIIMIQKMLKDLFFFICILAVFILSFGIAMQSLLHPYREFSFRLIVDAVYIPYWQIFGELFLERAEGKVDDPSVCTTNHSETVLNPSLKTCPQRTWLVPFLSMIYMMLTNVLLLNLLIAMFSYTFQMVQDNSEKVWRFYRYSLVYAYYDAPTFPPPFVILTHIKRLITFLYRNLKGTYHTTAGFKKILTLDENMKLSAFEKVGMERHMARTYRISVEQIDSRVALASQRLDQVVQDLEEIKEQLLGDVAEPAHTTQAQPKRHEDEKLVQLEMKVNTQTDLLRDLLGILRGASESRRDTDTPYHS